MFKIRDPLGLIDQNPQLKARVDFFEKVVKPICVILIVGPILFMGIVVIVEVIKHG